MIAPYHEEQLVALLEHVRDGCRVGRPPKDAKAERQREAHAPAHRVHCDECMQILVTRPAQVSNDFAFLVIIAPSAVGGTSWSGSPQHVVSAGHPSERFTRGGEQVVAVAGFDRVRQTLRGVVQAD